MLARPSLRVSGTGNAYLVSVAEDGLDFCPSARNEEPARFEILRRDPDEGAWTLRNRHYCGSEGVSAARSVTASCSQPLFQ